MKKNILIIGAGKSSGVLINYLLDQASNLNIHLIVADTNLDFAKSRIGKNKNGTAIALDINNEVQLTVQIKDTFAVISMLPAHMHMPVALKCLAFKKHLLTASYISIAMQALNNDVKKAGLLFLNECGLDPGLDHMSAMEIIDKLHDQKAVITSFKSYCGGLVAPKSNNNPWGYKFSWNPRNVVLAGQATAKYLLNNKISYTNYYNLFRKSEEININGYAKFDGYANRDSLSYAKAYKLNKVHTMIRGTLRQKNYCKAWHVLLQLGLTDDSFNIKNANTLTNKTFLQSFLGNESLEDFIKINTTKKDFIVVKKLIDYLELESNSKIKIIEGSPATILQSILEPKWKLKKSDKDLIVMQHEIAYTLNNKKFLIKSSLVKEGLNSEHTAMSETVGLPIGIAAKLLIQGVFKKECGVQIPIKKIFYKPILQELETTCGIVFKEIVNAL